MLLVSCAAGEKFLQQQDKDPLKEAQEAEDAIEEVALGEKLRGISWKLHVEAAVLQGEV